MSLISPIDFLQGFVTPSECGISIDFLDAKFGVLAPIPTFLKTTKADKLSIANVVNDEAVGEALVAVEHPVVEYVNVWGEGFPDKLFLRQAAAKRLLRAASLLPEGWSFRVLAGWQPQQAVNEVIRHFGKETEDTWRHSTGGVCDLTLCFEGKPLLLGFPYMHSTQSMEASDGRRVSLRDVLQRVLYWSMRDVGFAYSERLWWRYEFGTTYWAEATNCKMLYGPAELNDSDKSCPNDDSGSNGGRTN
jgi:D-alanyl-D-alanine dipeptidase